ncbi:MAG: InlB B-repeat-containing protein, partial [Candidatus Izemoplasmatales bacterium]|nr:InlB B-repeat-containing protein [Candidatus Izemoplasmatales bacterium]
MQKSKNPLVRRLFSLFTLFSFVVLIAFPLIACSTTTLTSTNTTNISQTTSGASTTNSTTNSTNSTTTTQQKDVFHSIAFFLNGGIGAQPSVQVVKHGNKAQMPLTNPTKEGHLFIGWFLDSEASQRFDFNQTITSTVLLYAGFEVEDEDYDLSLSEWSQPGFLYIHYRRFVNTEQDYADWSIWLWPWLGDGVAIEWSRFDQSGAIAAIDLTQVYTNGGPLGNRTVDFRDVNRVGFLVVFKPSKLGTGMWQSDGGADTFIDN